MASLTEHVMINKLGDDLDSAITFVGGDTTGVDNIMQYPTIIREQLSAGGLNLTKSILLEGDSCIIIADSEGRDNYNTEYAIGVKTGLNPGAYYIRICTAVKDIEPLYIDLTPIMDGIGTGSIDIDEVVRRVINSPEMSSSIQREVNSLIGDLEQRITDLENQDIPSQGLTTEEVQALISSALVDYAKKSDLESLESRIATLESKPDQVGVTEEQVQTLIDNSLIDYAKTADLDDKLDASTYATDKDELESRIKSLEERPDQVGVTEEQVQTLIDSSLNDYVSKDDYEGDKAEVYSRIATLEEEIRNITPSSPSTYEGSENNYIKVEVNGNVISAVLNEVNLDAHFAEKFTTEEKSEFVKAIEQKIETEVTAIVGDVVDTAVEEKLQSMSTDEGIDVEELNW